MSEMLTRRRLLINGGLAGLALTGGRLDLLAAQDADLWATAATILGRIKAPVFPARDILVTSHGAKGDGATDCTAAFRAAIDACRAAGGGRVVVPAGRFLTGAIRLRSGVNLHVQEGATIAFSTDPAKYLPLVLTRFEGVELINSPMWELNPVLCTNVIVRGVKIKSHGPNNDGCDPESCRDVLIEKCSFDTGDDCIALKSGRNEDGRRLHTPIENVIIRDCDMIDGHGGVTIGSEISGGAGNIIAEKCRMDSPRLDRALRFKNNAARGGLIERVAMRDVTVGEVAEAVIAADFFYEEGKNGGFKPVLRDVDVRNVTSRKSKHAFLLRGFDDSPISNVRISDCRFDGVQSDDVLEGVRDLVLTNVTVNGKRRDERINR